MIEGRDYWLWMTRIKGINKRDIAEILKKGYTPEELFVLDEKILREEIFASYKYNVEIAEFIRSRDIKIIEKYKRDLENKGISYISIDDDDYPYRLHCLYDKAYLLYYKGELQRHRLNIAIVGARRCTDYARNIAFKFAGDLAEKGVNIISGLAYGIDASAHLGALEAGGFTTAVVGCGFDFSYPSANKSLMDRIVKKGIVFSEYAPHMRPTRFTFPMRNRIISGLSDGVLLVEARKKSGSLITINHALDVGKDVFAVPLDILGKSNEGGNQVIRDGGKVVFNYEDILEAYPLFLESLKLRDDLELSSLEDEKELVLEGGEKLVYETISHHPTDLEEISENLAMGISELQFVLIKLEMKGVVKVLTGKRYIRNR